jgi:methyl-accepting chemotaxis protein
MLKNISIQKKLLLAMGSFILINMLIGAFTSYNVNLLKMNVERVESVQEAHGALLKFSRNIESAHSNLLEFFNSGDLGQRAEYQAIWDQVRTEKGALKETVIAIDDGLKGPLDKLYENLAQWHENIVSKQLVYMQSPMTVDMARLYEASEDNASIWHSINEQMEFIKADFDTEVKENSMQQRATMRNTFIVIALASVLTLISAIIASVFLVQTISKPLGRLVSVTSKLVEKDWGVQIEGTDRKDEIGQMATALLLFRDNGVEADRLMELQQEEDEKRLKRAQQIEELAAQFREDSSKTTEALEQATVDMKNASDSMTHIAAETSNLSARVAQAAGDTGSNVQSVSAATEELTASINEISEQLNRTSLQARSAQDAAQTAVDKMQTLEGSVNNVGSVIQIISDIAEQTNLLALNATIESARAGEAGKGFAVVANEVKSLANETAKATEQVRVQIEDMQRQTEEAVSMIQNISDVIEELTTASGSIAVAMEEQTTATQEISRNVFEAAAGTDEVVNSINQVNVATEETGSTAAKVTEVSNELSDRSRALKESIRTFIDAIRAA